MTSRRFSAFLRLSSFALMLAIAFALRFHLLGTQSLWHDEGISYVNATRALDEIAASAAGDIHPPGYYFALRAWVTFTGESEFALRALSAFASGLTVAVAYGIGRRIMPAWAAWLGAGFAALNTFNLYYAQETRMYALLALWGAASILLVMALAKRPSWRRALLLGVINAAGMWTHYAYAFVIAAQVVTLLIMLTEQQSKRGRMITLYLGSAALAFVLFLAWIPTAINQLSGWQQAGGIIPTAEAGARLAQWLIFGVTAENITLAIPILLLIAGLIAPVRGNRVWVAPILLAAVPVSLFLILGVTRESNLKFLLPAQIGAAVWMARGVWVISRTLTERTEKAFEPQRTPRTQSKEPFSLRSPRTLRLISFLLSGALVAWMLVNLVTIIPPFYTDARWQRADYRSVAARMEAELDANDAILLVAPGQSEVFGYYYHGDTPVYGLPINFTYDAATAGFLHDLEPTVDRIYALFWGERERDFDWNIESTLNFNTFLVDQQWIGDLRFARYLVNPDLPRECPLASFDSGFIRIAQCHMSRDTAAPGDGIAFLFGWQVEHRSNMQYKLFVQILNAEGRLVAQHDSFPWGGSAPGGGVLSGVTSPMTYWTEGAVYLDRHAILLPADLAPGTYTVIMGWYDASDPMRRLPVDGTAADYHTLGIITVESPE